MDNRSGILINGKLIPFGQEAHLPASFRHDLSSRLLAPPPVRHAEPSLVLSLDDEPWRPNLRLFQLSARLAADAPKACHPILTQRQGAGPRWFEVFPGEHYHLLTTLTRLLDAKSIWEFGTDTGMGTIALSEGMAADGRIVTVDIDPWRTKRGPWITDEDIATRRVTQIVSDMKARELFEQYAQELAHADLIFADGPKDGYTEAAFIELLAAVPFRGFPIVVFDDIRLVNMLATWRGISRPKMDLTSFGHWSGTGLIDWCPRNVD